MKYAWMLVIDVGLPDGLTARPAVVRAWVYAANAEEARSLAERSFAVACFRQVVRYEASRLLVWEEEDNSGKEGHAGQGQ